MVSLRNLSWVHLFVLYMLNDLLDFTVKPATLLFADDTAIYESSFDLICDIPWYRAFPRNTFIINISMYFGATEKWHVQMVMVSRVVQLAGASDAPPGTRVSNRAVYAVISVMLDV